MFLNYKILGILFMEKELFKQRLVAEVDCIYDSFCFYNGNKGLEFLYKVKCYLKRKVIRFLFPVTYWDKIVVLYQKNKLDSLDH